ncbi:FAD binding domain protein [Microdochium bolleyi]|uniref:FAD binding domain protein n=1 Tax=Microdochium bolleyi TaxID=196109 RepID=A0A136IRC2_9PEZI|nr:FAD binding domain protein [Microdochium bolleyi]
MRSPVALLAVLPLAGLVLGQTITDGQNNATLEANETTVAPAAQPVSKDSSAAPADLFTSEAAQLTDNIIANLTALNLTSIDLFSFDNGSSGTNGASKRDSGSCKSMPGDFLYPPNFIWKVFNLLLGGALIETTPLASPCYTNWGNYDAGKCSFINANWANNSYMHADDPTSVMWPLYQGLTCMPTTTPSDSCQLGAYPSYAIEARSVYQIQLAINFARNANLRLVVKNTGHDFNGKSAGAGALSIWTHKMKDIQFLRNYRSGSYSGPAFKLGAGVQAFEMYEAADREGVTAVGGEGKTVGVMGGYLAGGGHSPLSSIYGMAADQVLSMEVVTPDGRFVTASDSSNKDLFWALRGGGGSTFGVVTSVVLKVYPKMRVTVATWQFTTSSTVSTEAFWSGVRAYYDEFVRFTDKGTYSYFQLVGTGPGSFLFSMAPFVAPNMSKQDLEALLKPMFDKLSAVGIVANPNYFEYNTFKPAWENHFPLESVGSDNLKTASRLFPKANWLDAAKSNATFSVLRETVESGVVMLGFNIAASPKAGFPDNAVNPAWRNTVMHAICGVLWAPGSPPDVIAAQSKRLTNDVMQKWRDVSPGAGAYMSEADIMEPNFQQAFYGTKYQKLYQLKQRYDPFGVFYAPTGVGSEDWKIQDQIDGWPTQNGRLCRV